MQLLAGKQSSQPILEENRAVCYMQRDLIYQVISHINKYVMCQSRVICFMPVHPGRNHVARYFSNRCTRMYGVSLPSHIIMSKNQNQNCNVCKRHVYQRWQYWSSLVGTGMIKMCNSHKFHACIYDSFKKVSQNVLLINMHGGGDCKNV